MRIAATAEDARLDAPLDQHFGKCAFWVLADMDAGVFQIVANPGAGGGEGKCSATTQFLADRGVQCVLARKCGTQAREKLAAAGIRIVEGCEGTAREALHRFAREQESA